MAKLGETTVSQSCSYSSELTIFQIVPNDFHCSLFFKAFHSFLKAPKQEQKATNEKIKACLFMLFHIEGNSKWAQKFNNQLMKCHEMIQSNERSNFEGFLMGEEEKEEGWEEMEKQFVNVIESIEKSHDFEREIKIKKEMEKQKIIREINERLSFLNENNQGNRISNSNIVGGSGRFSTGAGGNNNNGESNVMQLIRSN